MRTFFGSLMVLSLFAGSCFAQAAPQAAAAPQQPAAQQEEIPPAAPGALFPALVARVNGKPILGRDLEQRVRAELTPIGNPAWKNLREDYRAQLTAESLGALIANELLYQQAVKEGVKATEKEIQDALAEFSKSFAGDAEMNLALASRGLDRDALRRELEQSVVVNRFIDDKVAKKVTVTPKEVSDYYAANTEEFRHPDLVRTSHILIMVSEGATPEQERLSRQRAEALLERARKGEDFAKLARENSMDPSASRGGDIGFQPAGQLASEYEDAAFALPVGGLSGVVRTRFGYHVIKVTEKKKEGLATLDEVREDLTAFLKDRKTDDGVAALVDDLREKASIEVFISLGPESNP